MKILEKTGQAVEGKKTILIDNDEIEIKTEMGDIIGYLKQMGRFRESTKKETDAIVDYQFNFIKKLVKQANPEVDEKIISRVIEENFNTMLMETLIALKLGKREAFEEQKELKN